MKLSVLRERLVQAGVEAVLLPPLMAHAIAREAFRVAVDIGRDGPRWLRQRYQQLAEKGEERAKLWRNFLTWW